MAVKLDKIKNLEYNETLTLMIIKSDPILNSTFASEFPIGLDLTITCSKENRIITDSVKNLIRSIFDELILTRIDLIDLYQSFAFQNKITISEVKEIGTESPVTSVEPIKSKPKVEKDSEMGAGNKSVKSIPKKLVTKTEEKTKVELPRRYGKEKILVDIANQGGKATPVQNTMLRVNDLKNIWVNLQARGIKTMLSEDKVLSDADCRDITSAILIMERKLETILKRK